MKKIFISLALALSVCHVASAQYEIKGKVTDSHGNPLPGAMVRNLDGNDYVLTDMDGNYSITVPYYKSKVEAVYGGWYDKKVKAKKAMRIKMVKPWWDDHSNRYRTILGFDFMMSGYKFPDNTVVSFCPCFMIGGLSRIGWYVKGGVSPSLFLDRYSFPPASASAASAASWYKRDADIMSSWTASWGIIFRLGCPLNLCVGPCFSGYSIRRNYSQTELSDKRTAGQDFVSFGLDASLMLRYKWFYGKIGCQLLAAPSQYYLNSIGLNSAFSIGLGFTL